MAETVPPLQSRRQPSQRRRVLAVLWVAVDIMCRVCAVALFVQEVRDHRRVTIPDRQRGAHQTRPDGQGGWIRVPDRVQSVDVQGSPLAAAEGQSPAAQAHTMAASPAMAAIRATTVPSFVTVTKVASPS